MKIKFVLRSSNDHSREATVVGEACRVCSKQAAVRKAKYGSEGKELMASFLNVASNLPNPKSAVAAVGKKAESRAEIDEAVWCLASVLLNEQRLVERHPPIQVQSARVSQDGNIEEWRTI